MRHSRRHGLPLVVVAFAALAVILAGCAKLDPSITELRLGDCVKDDHGGSVSKVEATECTDSNAVQVAYIYRMDGYAEFPGCEEMREIADAQCPNTARSAIFPTREVWDAADDERDRMLICFKQPNA